MLLKSYFFGRIFLSLEMCKVEGTQAASCHVMMNLSTSVCIESAPSVRRVLCLPGESCASCLGMVLLVQEGSLTNGWIPLLEAAKQQSQARNKAADQFCCPNP